MNTGVVVQDYNETFVRVYRADHWDADWYQVFRADDGRVIQEQRVDDIAWTVNMYTEFDEFAPSKQAINIDEWWKDTSYDDIPWGHGTYVDIWSCEVLA